MLGAIAQFAIELRAERQMDGIQKAKEQGVRFGRKHLLNTEQMGELRQRRRGQIPQPHSERRLILRHAVIEDDD
jgi:DNA invertase Pin-like site-specific DNA recombinase